MVPWKDNNKAMGNQRRSFRIDVEIGFEAKIVSEESLQQGIAELKRQPDWDATLPSALRGIDGALQELLDDLGRTAPKAAGAIALLNQKLDMVILGQQWEEKVKELSLRQVNLSATGLAFEYKQPIEVGRAMRCTLTLPQLSWTMVLYARVVNTRSLPDGGNTICLDYEFIREEDSEQLIRFNLLRQQQQLAGE